MCVQLDNYLKDLEKVEGLGAIQDFANKLEVNRVTLWRFRTGRRIPSKDNRKKIKRLTCNLVRPEHFIGE